MLGNTMNSIDVFDMNSSFIGVGRLELLQSFESRPNQAIGLPGNMPVLIRPVAASDAYCFAAKEGEEALDSGPFDCDKAWHRASPCK